MRVLLTLGAALVIAPLIASADAPAEGVVDAVPDPAVQMDCGGVYASDCDHYHGNTLHHCSPYSRIGLLSGHYLEPCFHY